MAWTDRLKSEIAFTSPNGQDFSAAWVGDNRTIEKKLGIFDYPDIAGSVVQDLEVRAVSYPLNFYFDGADHDLEADRFFNACKEKGVWSVIHPVRGTLSLQPISITEEIQPVTSGNITRFASEWIEPLEISTRQSVAQLSASIQEQSQELQNISADQFVATIELDQPSKIALFRNAVTETVGVINNALGSLTQRAADINASIQSITRGITAELSGDPLNVANLAGQIKALVSLPATAVTSISTVLSYYQELIGAMSAVEPSTPDASGINTAGVNELVLVSAVNSIIRSGSMAELESREQAVILLENITDIFINTTVSLDAMQSLYSGNAIDEQYFSQSQSYNSTRSMVGSITELLIRKSFDLAAAKRFTLIRDRCPVEIAATEYRDLYHFDFFIESNGLKSFDIILLPAGREVVVYL